MEAHLLDFHSVHVTPLPPILVYKALTILFLCCVHYISQTRQPRRAEILIMKTTKSILIWHPPLQSMIPLNLSMIMTSILHRMMPRLALLLMMCNMYRAVKINFHSIWVCIFWSYYLTIVVCDHYPFLTLTLIQGRQFSDGMSWDK